MRRASSRSRRAIRRVGARRTRARPHPSPGRGRGSAGSGYSGGCAAVATMSTDIPEYPEYEDGYGHGEQILDDQREALRPCGRIGPCEWRRYVRAVASVLRRNVLTICESGRGETHGRRQGRQRASTWRRSPIRQPRISCIASQNTRAKCGNVASYYAREAFRKGPQVSTGIPGRSRLDKLTCPEISYLFRVHGDAVKTAWRVSSRPRR